MLWTSDSGVTRENRRREAERAMLPVLSVPETTCEDGEAVHSSTLEIAQ